MCIFKKIVILSIFIKRSTPLHLTLWCVTELLWKYWKTVPVKSVLLNGETQSGNLQLDDILERMVGKKPFQIKVADYISRQLEKKRWLVP